MIQAIDLAASLLTSTAALWRGTSASEPARQPVRRLELYDIENCPYCRLVREALTELNLEALILPCPKGGTRYRPRAEALGGKMQFPFLVDANTGVNMYESAEIVRYLHKQYGQGDLPSSWRLRLLEVTQLV